MGQTAFVSTRCVSHVGRGGSKMGAGVVTVELAQAARQEAQQYYRVRTGAWLARPLPPTSPVEVATLRAKLGAEAALVELERRVGARERWRLGERHRLTPAEAAAAAAWWRWVATW